MTARELESTIHYTGQWHDLRRLCIKESLVPIDKLAVMESTEVCSVVLNHYKFLGYSDGGQTILLVKNEDWDAVQKLVDTLER
jgi:hypothetical protein